MKVIKITKAGYIYIFLTISLGFASINTGNNLVYLITSALLGFMGISGFFGRKNIYSLQVELEFPEEVFANREFPLKIKLTNVSKLMPSFLIEISINNKHKILIPFIDKGKVKEKTIFFTFEKRGENNIENILISSHFPFNFFVRFNRVKKRFSKTVFPEPLKYPFYFSSSYYREIKGILDNSRKGESGDIISLREYTEKDSIKFIHWKSFAKTGKLMVKEMTDDSDLSPLIVYEEITISDLEVKLSFLTFLILFFNKKGMNPQMKANNKIITNKSQILHYLALK
jgi:uncharacterized protein (DUF58 family)